MSFLNDKITGTFGVEIGLDRAVADVEIVVQNFANFISDGSKLCDRNVFFTI